VLGGFVSSKPKSLKQYHIRQDPSVNIWSKLKYQKVQKMRIKNQPKRLKGENEVSFG
jgi:hypothetical protein